MNKLFSLIFCTLVLTGFTYTQNNLDKSIIDSGTKSMIGPRILFDYKLSKADTIPQGTPYVFSFPFKNLGDAPLIIYNVQSSCGCYTPLYYNKDTISPGDSGIIQGRYNAAAVGFFNKNLRVRSNDTTSNPIFLYAQGVVVKRKQDSSEKKKQLEIGGSISTNQPKVNFLSDSVNLGIIEKGNPHVFYYTFVNAGSSPTRIYI